MANSSYPILRQNIVRITPSLAVVGAGKGEIHGDYSADGWQVVDLRNWSKPADPRDDSGKLFRHANAIAACIKHGQKVLLVDQEGKDRVSLAAAAALVSLGKSGSAASQQVLDSHPQAFSGLSERARARWMQFLQSLDPTIVKNVKPAPKPSFLERNS